MTEILATLLAAAVTWAVMFTVAWHSERKRADRIFRILMEHLDSYEPPIYVHWKRPEDDPNRCGASWTT